MHCGRHRTTRGHIKQTPRSSTIDSDFADRGDTIAHDDDSFDFPDQHAQSPQNGPHPRQAGSHRTLSVPKNFPRSPPAPIVVWIGPRPRDVCRRRRIFVLAKRHFKDNALLCELIQEEPRYFLSELRDLIYRRVRRRYHISTIWRALKRNTYTRKKLKYLSDRRDREEREAFRFELDLLRQQGATFDMFLCLDETNADYRAWRQHRGYVRRGQKPTIIDCFGGNRYSMIAAANSSGFLLDVCMEGFWDVADGNNNKSRFLTWFEFSLLPHLGNFTLREQNSILVLDNCNIHDKDEVERLAATREASYRDILRPTFDTTGIWKHIQTR